MIAVAFMAGVTITRNKNKENEHLPQDTKTMIEKNKICK